jgi:cellulose synthase/poly-beta-1,6-N-acetylglucosamine synthase-like glycosyltransferase
MPAHNESAGLSATLQALLPQLREDDRALVVADNCSDNTAVLARAAGAECVERSDPTRRGKGYALDFGVRMLEHDPRPVVVIVDADCSVEPGSLDRLALACSRTGRPAQALYLMQGEPGGPLLKRIATFAWRIRNHARPLGALRLGAPCQLMGTGMAFPWAVLRGAPLASSHIVEDLQLGADLARRGTPALFVPSARVTSRLPDHEDGAQAQRRRWEHGHLATLFAEAPRLLLQALRTRSGALFWLAADLAVPPLALFALIVGVLSALQIGFGLANAQPASLAAGAALLTTLTGAIALGWHRFGRDLLSARDLAAAPWYALRKIPLYLAFAFNRQTGWNRAKRDGE